LEEAVRNAAAEKGERRKAKGDGGDEKGDGVSVAAELLEKSDPSPFAFRLSPLSSSLSRDDLLAAIKSGARLRLRPKVMTVATIVASLLPIMWSTRPGAEIMKPLAAPVIGGMVSSLLHILIVTPVIFAWLRERELRAPRRSE